MKHCHFYFLLFCNLLIGFQACSPTPTVPETATTTPTIPKYTQLVLDKFEKKFQQRFSNAGCPGAVVTIVHNGEIYSKGFGVRRAGYPGMVDKSTIFRIGSLSKGFAGALSSILVQDGLLSWEEKIAEVIPGFRLKDSAQTERVTIKHVLSHSTGLQRHAFTNLVEAGISIENIIPEFSGLDLISQEGEIYAYGNAPFAMIENVLSRKANKSFAELLEEKIFEPADMNRSSSSYQDFTRAGNIAYPHFFSSKTNRFAARKISEKYYNAISAGGINASGEDMGHWLNLLLGHRPDILSNKALDELFKPIVPTRSRRYYDRWSNYPTHYALGWRVIDFDDFQLIHHGGYVNNYRSEIAFDRENDMGICVLFNASNPEANLIVPDFLDCVKSAQEEMLLLDQHSVGQ